MEGIKYVYLIEIGPVVIEIQGVVNSELVVSVNVSVCMSVAMNVCMYIHMCVYM